MTAEFGALLAGFGGAGLVGVAGTWLWRAADRRAQVRWQAECERERAAGAHLCNSTIESLAAAMEAGDPYNAGHLDCVLRIVAAMSRAMKLSAEDAAALKAAAMLHNIGRLGVPDHLLHKT